MQTTNKSKYPNTYYRVSLKAIIRNKKGEVLVVKEKGSKWSLPGGGIDHDESFEDGLKREMYEEAKITQPFLANIVGVDAFFRLKNQDYLMWVVCELTFDKPLLYGVGEDADEVAFMDPALFKNSKFLSEQLLYKWCTGKSA